MFAKVKNRLLKYEESVYNYPDMDNCLEAKHRAMLRCNRLRRQRWECSILGTVSGASTAERTARESPILT